MGESSHSAPKKPLLGDKSYQALKQSATLILPAIGALYFALAQIWHLPKAEEVVGSVAAVNTFVGVLLGVSTRSYNNSETKYAGKILVEDTGLKKTFTLQLNDADPESIEKLDEATFKVDGSTTGEHPFIRP